MIHLCHCEIEFEPTPRQLGQLKRGNKIHHSAECALKYRCWQRKMRYQESAEERKRQRLRNKQFRANILAKKKFSIKKQENLIIRAKKKASVDCGKYSQCIESLCHTNQQLRCDKCLDPDWLEGAWMKTREQISNIRR